MKRKRPFTRLSRYKPTKPPDVYNCRCVIVPQHDTPCLCTHTMAEHNLLAGAKCSLCPCFLYRFVGETEEEKFDKIAADIQRLHAMPLASQRIQ